MIGIYMPDVGDGLALGLRTHDRWSIQVDCGSQQIPFRALQALVREIQPDAFILSHFHADHYNGLLGQNTRKYKGVYELENHLWVHEVCFPRIPEFPDNRRFAEEMSAMNFLILGARTGDMAADFLEIISHMNIVEFNYRPLCQGDTFGVRGSQFSVLWPPRTLDRTATLRIISKAMSDFDQAVAEDETTRRIYHWVMERSEVNRYLDTDEAHREMPGLRNKDEGRFASQLRKWSSVRSESAPLPAVVQKANESLRKAANHLSLAFHQDNQILFLGDLEKPEIKQVVDQLVSQDLTEFRVLITPHHGTHWDDSLSRLRFQNVLSSTGAKLVRHVSLNYKQNLARHYITHLMGDIRLRAVTNTWVENERPDFWSW